MPGLEKMLIGGALALLVFAVAFWGGRLLGKCKTKQKNKTDGVTAQAQPQFSETDAALKLEPSPDKQPTKAKAKVSNAYHISQNKDGESEHSKEWRVRKAGSDKTIQYFATQKEAIAFAKELASKNNGKVVVHKTTGTIRKHK